MAPKSAFLLPTDVVSPLDLNRLLREVEGLDEALRQAGLRGGRPGDLPKTGRVLEETAHLNDLNLLQQEQREGLLRELKALKSRSPIVHMSFSADPSPVFMRKLVAWFRQHIHPYVLITVGLQPTIGAGCILRTTNQQFDFSLRARFQKSRPILLERLHSAVREGVQP